MRTILLQLSLRCRNLTTALLKKPFIISFFLHLCPALFAQDNLGIAGSTRAPANTVLNNPSTIVDSRALIDINLVGISAFVRNNLVFIPGKSFSSAMFDTMTTVPLTEKKGPYSVYADIMAHGPSATFAIKKHAFGLYTGARVVSDVRGIPENAKTLIRSGFQSPDQMGVQQNYKNVRANALGWGEVGLSYGTIIQTRGDAIIQGGATIKRLFGVAGAGIRIDNWSYIVQDSSRLETQKFTGEYGFNDPTAGILNGKGWGMDLGITYKMRKSDSKDYIPHSPCTDGDYLYRIGVSLLDVGRVKFNGPFYRNEFSQNEGSEWRDYQAATANDIGDIDSLINNNFDLVQQNSNDGKFKMKLPTAISAQFDYNLTHNFYVYGVMTVGLPRLNSLGVQRASYLGIAPRWEIKRFEFSLPMSMYEWKHPQLGFCARLNSVIIGSDNLGALLFKRDIYGADFYLSLKYTIFKHRKCNPKEKKSKVDPKSGTHTAKPCPTW
jgi:hypothetical protein